MMLDMDRRYIWMALGLILLLVFAGGMKYGEMRNQNLSKTEVISKVITSDEEASKQKKEDIIQVYVTGAVEKPGVYRLPAGARAYEAIEMAQSLPTANLKNINLAQKIEDGQPIVVPEIGEETQVNVVGNGLMMGTAASKPGSTGKVNINSASVQELDGLPGIGPTLAQRITEYRNSHGSFARIEDLNEVSGIGDKKYADIKDLITVR
jgi:competence protein ComEA